MTYSKIRVCKLQRNCLCRALHATHSLLQTNVVQFFYYYSNSYFLDQTSSIKYDFLPFSELALDVCLDLQLSQQAQRTTNNEGVAVCRELLHESSSDNLEFFSQLSSSCLLFVFFSAFFFCKAIIDEPGKRKGFMLLMEHLRSLDPTAGRVQLTRLPLLPVCYLTSRLHPQIANDTKNVS